MNLIIEKNNIHVSLDAIKEFENAIKASIDINITNRNNPIIDIVFKVAKRLRIDSKLIKTIRPFIKSKSDNFTILMGPHFAKCIPAMLSKGNNGIYIYDAWPKEYAYIDRMIKSFNLKFIYFSSKKVAELYSSKFRDIEVKWIPEAINLKEYSFEAFEKKDIDVLQLGRKYDEYHNAIIDQLQTQKVNYLFERIKGEIIFPDRKDFILGLARTKISICVPSSITHPERSGNISSVTLRYWQSMASKCLIVGIMPEEMSYLFDYTPIIPIDMENPAGQIINILNNFDNYLPLIEKNYQNVLNNHTWNERIKIMDCIR